MESDEPKRGSRRPGRDPQGHCHPALSVREKLMAWLRRVQSGFCYPATNECQKILLFEWPPRDRELQFHVNLVN